MKLMKERKAVAIMEMVEELNLNPLTMEEALLVPDITFNELSARVEAQRIENRRAQVESNRMDTDEGGLRRTLFRDIRKDQDLDLDQFAQEGFQQDQEMRDEEEEEEGQKEGEDEVKDEEEEEEDQEEEEEAEDGPDVEPAALLPNITEDLVGGQVENEALTAENALVDLDETVRENRPVGSMVDSVEESPEKEKEKEAEEEVRPEVEVEEESEKQLPQQPAARDTPPPVEQPRAEEHISNRERRKREKERKEKEAAERMRLSRKETLRSRSNSSSHSRIEDTSVTKAIQKPRSKNPSESSQSKSVEEIRKALERSSQPKKPGEKGWKASK